MTYNSRPRVPDETCRNREDIIYNRGSRENVESVLRGMIQENERCNDKVKGVNEIEVGSSNRKRRDSVSPLPRLNRSCRRRGDVVVMWV